MNTDIMALAPDETKLEEQENKALAIAKAMVITNDAELVEADRFCVKLLALEKLIKSDFKASKEAAFAAHRAITDQESAHLAKVQEPRTIIKPKIAAYQKSQEEARAAEEKRLQAIADKKAEDEALELAQKAESSGDKKMAEAILAAPVISAPVILPKSEVKVQTRLVQPWEAITIPIERMTNQQLINARAYLTWDTVKLGQQARSTHDTVKVDGVTFRQKPL